MMIDIDVRQLAFEATDSNLCDFFKDRSLERVTPNVCKGKLPAVELSLCYTNSLLLLLIL